MFSDVTTKWLGQGNRKAYFTQTQQPPKIPPSRITDILSPETQKTSSHFLGDTPPLPSAQPHPCLRKRNTSQGEGPRRMRQHTRRTFETTTPQEGSPCIHDCWRGSQPSIQSGCPTVRAGPTHSARSTCGLLRHGILFSAKKRFSKWLGCA